MKLTREELAACMDYTLLKPEATASDIDRVCADALRLSTASVCVNPCWVSRVAESLSGSTVATCTVIGFPLGATSTEAKVAEASRALRDGARELDMVSSRQGCPAQGNHRDLPAHGRPEARRLCLRQASGRRLREDFDGLLDGRCHR